MIPWDAGGTGLKHVASSQGLTEGRFLLSCGFRSFIFAAPGTDRLGAGGMWGLYAGSLRCEGPPALVFPGG